MTTTAVATLDTTAISSFAIFSPDVDVASIGEVMAENMGGEEVSAFDLPRVKVPAGGTTTFNVPTIDGDVDMKELVGIIAFIKPGRSWWEVSMEESGGGSAPDCSSDDGVTGTKFGSCADCPRNKFGSARKGAGKDCKETRSVFLLTQGDLLPIVVSVPPTSIKPLKQFQMRLSSAIVPMTGVVTRITLNKTKNAGGIAYAEMAFAVAGKLSPEQRRHVAGYAAALKESFMKAHSAAVRSGAAASNHSQDSYEPMPEDNPYGDVE